MNIPNYRSNIFAGLDFLAELRLLSGGSYADRRLVCRRWVAAILSPGGYGQYRILEHQHTLDACMRARQRAVADKRLREEEEADERLVCSFCGKDKTEVGHMIRGLDQTHDVWITLQTAAATKGEGLASVDVPVCICDECVILCAEVIAKEKGGPGATGTARNHKENSL